MTIGKSDNSDTLNILYRHVYCVYVYIYILTTFILSYLSNNHQGPKGQLIQKKCWCVCLTKIDSCHTTRSVFKSYMYKANLRK